jgi:predicted transcriptional regulator
MSTTVRVSRQTHERLVRVAAETGQRILSVVEEAVAAYEADMFWDAFDAGWQRVAEDPQAWAEVQAERIGQAPALADDLDRD